MCVVKYKFTSKTGSFESYDSHQLLCGGMVARKWIETGGHSYSTWLYAVKLHLSQGFVTVRGWEVLKFARCFLKTTFVF